MTTTTAGPLVVATDAVIEGIGDFMTWQQRNPRARVSLATLTAWRQMLLTARAAPHDETAIRASLVAALKQMQMAWCGSLCPRQEDGHDWVHEMECADARAALKEAGE